MSFIIKKNKSFQGHWISWLDFFCKQTCIFFIITLIIKCRKVGIINHIHDILNIRSAWHCLCKTHWGWTLLSLYYQGQLVNFLLQPTRKYMQIQFSRAIKKREKTSVKILHESSSEIVASLFYHVWLKTTFFSWIHLLNWFSLY